MAKTDLEQTIENASNEFALFIINAVKSATLQELIALQSDGAPRRPERQSGFKPGPTPWSPEAPVDAAPVRRKRVVKNYPKCAYPDCDKNRFPRGKGFCGEHWRQFEAGQIESADHYRKLTS